MIEIFGLCSLKVHINFGIFLLHFSLGGEGHGQEEIHVPLAQNKFKNISLYYDFFNVAIIFLRAN